MRKIIYRILSRFQLYRTVMIIYPEEMMNEQSETMKGQTQTTKFIRDVFEQYRRADLEPKWKIDESTPPRFIGIELKFLVAKPLAQKP